MERLVMSVGSGDDGCVAVLLEGELDLEVCDALESALRALSSGTGQHLVLDLRRLRFLDSTGLRAIVSIVRSVEREGGTLRLIQGPWQIRRVFELTGMDRTIRFVAADDLTPIPGNDALSSTVRLASSGSIAS